MEDRSMKEGWEYKKLGEVCDIYQPKTISSKELVEDGKYLVYGANGVIGKYNSYNHESSEVLMTCRGATCGTINVSKPYSWINGNAMVIHPLSSTLTSNFLVYLLKGMDLSDVITGAAQPQITRQSLAPKKIAVPPLSEQQHIVEELDLLSSIIEKKKAQINELDNLAQSLFYEMFGDPITNDKGWKVIRLGDKCQVSSFKRVLIEDVVDKGIPFIRGTELMTLSNGDDVNFTLFITPEHYEVVKEISGVPIIGDLLIPSINAKGNIWIVNTEQPRYYKDGRVLWVHVDSESYTSETLKFIMSLLIKKTYSVVASGATFAELKLFVLRDLRTIIPPISIQQRFSESIKGIEHQKKLIKQSIKEVETLFNSRMDYYFN